MTTISTYRRRLLQFSLFLIPLMIGGTVRAQTPCDVQTLETAHSRFDLGLFGETFAIVRPCMPEGFEDKTLRIDGYRLMALSYIAVDSLDDAREWIRRILDEDGRYRSDPDVDPPVFTEYVNSLKPNWYNWLWKGKQWYHWAGRGLIVGAAVGVPLLIQSNQRQPLPGPPAFPSQ